MFERVPEGKNNSLKKAISVLESGGIIVYPTETIYGFGCVFLLQIVIKTPLQQQVLIVQDKNHFRTHMKSN